MSDLSDTLVKELLAEQRKNRFWRNIRFFILLVVLLAVIALIYGSNSQSTASASSPYAALVKMNGVVAPGQDFSANTMVPLIEQAFKNKDAKAVVLEINSPGGSPVQAQIIYDQIIALKKQYHKPVIAVGEDVMASAAYLVASAADKIYVAPETLTGSIGVRMDSFGFTGLMSKVGVTRRLFTAGEHKALADPFLPLKQGDVNKINSVLAQAHQDFINDVKNGRGKRLKTNDDELFSGEFWLGSRAVQLGLADGISNIYQLKKSLKIKDYEVYAPEKSLLQQLAFNAIEKVSLAAQNNWHLQA
jgi:protease-4